MVIRVRNGGALDVVEDVSVGVFNTSVETKGIFVKTDFGPLCTHVGHQRDLNNVDLGSSEFGYAFLRGGNIWDKGTTTANPTVPWDPGVTIVEFLYNTATLQFRFRVGAAYNQFRFLGLGYTDAAGGRRCLSSAAATYEVVNGVNSLWTWNNVPGPGWAGNRQEIGWAGF